ncbi:MAG TPA: DNA-binding transcriptional regulator [Cytophagales bacterium]|jgi:predicted DNA-binding transcriptional regulator YafY|nr:DNA-binding transcriptional regulator [Cytophagales bacterium]
MAYSDNISRLSRLTAILLKLQTNTSVSVERLSEYFEVSKRTIYRDLASLEQAGVPIIHIEGKGYGLMEGYRLPPIMFTEEEANALIFGEKLIAKTKDESLIKEFNKATDKIKSVLRNSEKEKVDFLSKRTIIGKNWHNERTSSFLSDIQKALTNYQVVEIEYRKEGADDNSKRKVEPFAIYHNTSENWVLIAWCRLRKEFRSFRIDRIQKMTYPLEKFVPHKMTLDEYVEIQRKKHF